MSVTMPPVWEDELVRIEPLALAHIEHFIALRADPEVNRYVARDPFASREEAEALLQKIVDDNAEGRGCNWLISDRASGVSIGSGGIWRIDRTHDIGEVGYALLPAWWGRGILRRALVPMLDHVFKKQNLHRIEANVDPRNQRSSGLLLRLGFRLEAHLRENYKYRDRYLDSEIYGLLKSDWPT